MRDLRPFPALIAGAGMSTGSFLTIRHYFEANFPATLYEGSFCDISTFFNCDSSAFSTVSAVWGVPIGTFGFAFGLMMMAAVVLSSRRLERTVRFLSIANVLGVVALLAHSVFVLGSLCLLCAVYYLFSLVGLWATWRGAPGISRFVPSPVVLAVSGVVTLIAAFGMAEYHAAREMARSGSDSARIATQFRELPRHDAPSVLSPNWIVRSSARFDDAPIRVVAWEDFLCSDCRFVAEQFERLKSRYEGRLNLVFQHFPLDAACNDVVDKDKHPGACDLAAMVLYAPEHFETIYREVFVDQLAAKDAGWRAALAERLGITAALTDSSALALLDACIQTGREYEQTSDRFPYGIRSTPTMLINGRLVIGTFPDDLLVAMLDAAYEEEAPDSTRFLESWQ